MKGGTWKEAPTVLKASKGFRSEMSEQEPSEEKVKGREAGREHSRQNRVSQTLASRKETKWQVPKVTNESTG